MIEKLIIQFIQKAYTKWPYMVAVGLISFGVGYFAPKIKEAREQDQAFKKDVTQSLKSLTDSMATKNDLILLEKEIRHEIDTTSNSLSKDISKINYTLKRSISVLGKHIEISNISTDKKFEELKELYGADEQKKTFSQNVN